MNKLKMLVSLTVLVFLISLSFSSAYFQVSSPSFRSSYSDSAFSSLSDKYSDFVKYPVSDYNQMQKNSFLSKNQDSINYNRNYQGPTVERTTRYDEFLRVRSRGRVIRTISAATTERYLGASLNEAYSNQNNNIRTSEQTSQTSSNYDGGFSWRNREAFDSSRYNSGSSVYYYQPRYDYNLGYYNWRY